MARWIVLTFLGLLWGPAALQCPPSEGGTKELWRLPPRAYEMSLNSTNINCPLSCASQNVTYLEETQDDSRHHHVPLQIEVQEDDWILLHVDLSGLSDAPGNVSHVTFHAITMEDMKSCSSFPGEPLVHWMLGNRENVVVGSDILLPGNQLFGVWAILPHAGCNVSWALNVTVRGQQCRKAVNSEVCSGHGACVLDSSQISYSCQCCKPGYVGRYCEERDGCQGNPCRHGGFCVDITEGLSGDSFQCLCPHGFVGQRCEEPASPCGRKPCQNGGTCRQRNSSRDDATGLVNGRDSEYWCECPPNYMGQHCQTAAVVPAPDDDPTGAGNGGDAQNACVPNPCIHGVCEDTDSGGGYKCYCLPGYGGDHCEFEYDECDSSPCINAGACEDLVAGYRCHCGPGYRGRRCQIKVDLCQPNPCPEPAQCVDKGNNYSCVCHPGYNGNGCTQHYDPCYPNPCQNSGTCWPSLDSYFCSCQPGFAGDTCEEPRYPSAPTHPRSSRSGVQGSAAEGGAGQPPDHLHNMYIAAATLAGACLVVLLVVSVCTCRAHHRAAYQRFLRRSSSSLSDIKELKSPRQLLVEPPWERF